MKPTEIIHDMRACAHNMMLWAKLLKEKGTERDRANYFNRLEEATANMARYLDQLQEVLNG